MIRWVVWLTCGLGWLVLAAGVIAPLAGMVLAAVEPGSISTAVVGVPVASELLVRSVTLAALATVGAILLGLWPAAVLGASQGRWAAVLTGLVIAPLLVPPQVYAYAWGLLATPDRALTRLLPARLSPCGAGVLRAALITAAWLWPVVALILAAGWRSAGRAVYRLAILDTSPGRAFLLAVLPSLRPHLIAAGALVFVISLLEYPIPHLMLSRVYATELMVLVEVGAPPGQIMRMAVQVIALVAAVGAMAAWSLRGLENWQAMEPDDDLGASPAASRPGWWSGSTGGAWWLGAAAVWLLSVAVPVILMAANLRVPGAWREGLHLFARQWQVSLAVSLIAATLAVIMAASTVVMGRAASCRWLRLAALAAVVTAAVPPTALGIGTVLIYNRAGIIGDLYTQTPVIWILALVGRYGAVAVLITWLATARRNMVTVDQARVDGAAGSTILACVLLPLVWPSLLAAGLIVAMLSLFEVVVTQMVGPVGFPSIALTILNHMHYGRDDVVITTSLIVVAAGVVVTALSGWLLARSAR